MQEEPEELEELDELLFESKPFPSLRQARAPVQRWKEAVSPMAQLSSHSLNIPSKDRPLQSARPLLMMQFRAIAVSSRAS